MYEDEHRLDVDYDSRCWSGSACGLLTQDIRFSLVGLTINYIGLTGYLKEVIKT